MKKMALYSAPRVIAGFAGIINETLDRALLKHLLVNNHSLEYAEAQVGIYSACYKLAMLVTIFLQAYRYAAEPFFFAQAKKENRNEIYSMVMNYFIGLVCFVFLFVSLNIEFFKYFIQNEAYWVGLDIVPILLLANICLGIYYNQSIWYKLSGKTKFGAYIALMEQHHDCLKYYICSHIWILGMCIGYPNCIYCTNDPIIYTWTKTLSNPLQSL